MVKTALGLAVTTLNVLYIVVDDLRTELGCYMNNTSANISPNIDEFAKSATLFERAYCSQAVCSPSRNSFLTGRTPDQTRIWNFKGSFRDTEIEDGQPWYSLPQWFKRNGWVTAGMGKIFHPNSPPRDDPRSWTLPYFQPRGGRECVQRPPRFLNRSHNLSCVAADETATVDYLLVEHALSTMHNLSTMQASVCVCVCL